MKEFIINEKNAGQRLDKFLFRIIVNEQNSFVYKMLRKKNITLNDKKSDGKDILSVGDSVKLWFSDESFEKLTKNNSSLNQNIQSQSNHNQSNVNSSIKMPSIIYEDENVILLNKPVGLLSQKADSNDISVNELLIDYLLKKGELSVDDMKFYKPSTVNRLDRNTSGIIVAAKNLRAAQILSEGFKDRTINKYYKCLVHGKIMDAATIKGFLVKDEKLNKVKIYDKEVSDSSYIETSYEPIDYIEDKTLLSVHLITGKTHQIRAHLASISHPLCGDRKYGARDKYKYQCLHCYKVVFPKYDSILKNISEKSFYVDMEKPWA